MHWWCTDDALMMRPGCGLDAVWMRSGCGLWVPYLISLNPLLFKNIAHVGSFKNFVFVFVFVFVCVCVFVNCNAISTLDYIYLLQHRMIELILYYIQEDLLLKVLVFVFVFVFVCVFVFVSVITRWTLALSSFRRCIICWIWCSNHENIDVLMLIGLVAGEGEGGGEEEERESHSKVGTLLGPTISLHSYFRMINHKSW